jgi:hypothetical protein
MDIFNKNSIAPLIFFSLLIDLLIYVLILFHSDSLYLIMYIWTLLVLSVVITEICSVSHIMSTFRCLPATVFLVVTKNFNKNYYYYYYYYYYYKLGFNYELFIYDFLKCVCFSCTFYRERSRCKLIDTSRQVFVNPVKKGFHKCRKFLDRRSNHNFPRKYPIARKTWGYTVACTI